MSENLTEEKVETTQEEKDVEVTLEENNEPIVNSTTEDKSDSGQVEQKADEPDDKELQDVGKGAQDRIKKLTTKYKNDERAKQEAERKAEETSLENQKLKERLENLDKGILPNTELVLMHSLSRLKRIIKKPMTQGMLIKCSMHNKLLQKFLLSRNAIE